MVLGELFDEQGFGGGGGLVLGGKGGEKVVEDGGVFAGDHEAAGGEAVG